MSNKLCLWKFRWGYGGSRYIESQIKATRKDVESIIGKSINFQDSISKHSEVYGVIEEGEFTLISDDLDFVNKSIEIGLNPFNFISKDDEED